MSELEPSAGEPRDSAKKRFFGRFKHRWWGWVLSALAAFLATLAPEVIRALCLTFAAVVAIATFHKTEFANRRLKRTIPTAILFIIAAVCLFVGAGYWDRRGGKSSTTESSGDTPTEIAKKIVGDLPASKGFLQLEKVDIFKDYASVSVNHQFAFRGYFVNRANAPVTNVHAFGGLTVPLTTLTHGEEVDLARQLIEIREKVRANSVGTTGPTVGSGQETYVDAVSEKLNAAQVGALLRHRTRIYVYWWASWVNVKGHEDSAEQCLSTETPRRDLTKLDFIWKVCANLPPSRTPSSGVIDVHP